MSREFGPGMIGTVVKVVTTNLNATDVRTVVGKLVTYCEYERTGASPTKMGWFQVEGEPEDRVAFDECHSSEVEVFL